MRRFGGVVVVLVWLVGAVASHAAGIKFLGEKCAFDYWPRTGWTVAPPTEGEGGSRLLRASHEPRLGLAIEAWVGPIIAKPDEIDTEEMQRSALTSRGWNVGQISRTIVGGNSAQRARAHRREAGRLFVLDEYQFDAGGRHFTLRVTGLGVGALQNPEIRRWLQSFRLL